MAVVWETLQFTRRRGDIATGFLLLGPGVTSLGSPATVIVAASVLTTGGASLDNRSASIAWGLRGIFFV